MKPDIDQLLLHKRTRLLLRQYLMNPSQPLLMVGDVGAGKNTVAEAVSAKLLDITPDALESYPFFLHISKDTGSREISIDAVRDIIKRLMLKVPGSRRINRVIYIDNSQHLSLEAQNALLKILEEPSPESVFVLTATTDRSLLPTITSRAHKIPVHPVSMDAALEYYADKYSSEAVESAWQLSQGSLGLLGTLLQEDEDHPLKEAIKQAKLYLRQTPYQRYQTLDSVSKDKNDLEYFLDALGRIFAALNHQAVSGGQSGQTRRLLKDRKTVSDLRDKLASNVNSKLITLQLLMKLSL